MRTQRFVTITLSALAAAILPSSGSAQAAEAEVIAVVDSYHAALAAGDSTAALSLLADDVTILALRLN